MKKFAVILAGLVLLALLVLVLLFFSGPAPAVPAASNAISGNAAASNATASPTGNATLGNVAASNATASPTGNATLGNVAASNATASPTGNVASNATAGNATASGPPPAPHDLVAGAYLSPAVANGTAGDLRERGLAPAVFRRPDAAGAVWWEVHLGRFPDAAAARAEADRLGAEQGVWAWPRPVDPQAKPVAAVKGPATVYLVSAGQYLTRHAAEERGRELAALGFEPCVVRMPGAGDTVWYAVAVGQAKSGEEAEALAAGLAAKTGLSGRVSAEDAASLAGRRLCE